MGCPFHDRVLQFQTQFNQYIGVGMMGSELTEMFVGFHSSTRPTPGAIALLLALPQVQRLYLNELAEMPSESVELGLVRLIVEPEESAIVQAQQLINQVESRPSRLSASAIIEMIETIMVDKCDRPLCRFG